MSTVKKRYFGLEKIYKTKKILAGSEINMLAGWVCEDMGYPAKQITKGIKITISANSRGVHHVGVEVGEDDICPDDLVEYFIEYDTEIITSKIYFDDTQIDKAFGVITRLLDTKCPESYNSIVKFIRIKWTKNWMNSSSNVQPGTKKEMDLINACAHPEIGVLLTNSNLSEGEIIVATDDLTIAHVLAVHLVCNDVE